MCAGFGDANDAGQVALSADAIAASRVELCGIDDGGFVGDPREVFLRRAVAAFATDAAALEWRLLVAIERVGDEMHACCMAIQA